MMLAMISLMFGTGCSMTFFPKGKQMEVCHPENPNKTCHVKTLVAMEF